MSKFFDSLTLDKLQTGTFARLNIATSHDIPESATKRIVEAIETNARN
jgi:bifunctional pyridoxal-dependent enzyme with beta-cystathionase and maltose regulon repressor activities